MIPMRDRMNVHQAMHIFKKSYKQLYDLDDILKPEIVGGKRIYSWEVSEKVYKLNPELFPKVEWETLAMWDLLTPEQIKRYKARSKKPTRPPVVSA